MSKRGSVEITWEYEPADNKVTIESYETESGDSQTLGEFDVRKEWGDMKQAIAEEIASWIDLRMEDDDDE